MLAAYRKTALLSLKLFSVYPLPVGAARLLIFQLHLRAKQHILTKLLCSNLSSPAGFYCALVTRLVEEGEDSSAPNLLASAVSKPTSSSGLTAGHSKGKLCASSYETYCGGASQTFQNTA